MAKHRIDAVVESHDGPKVLVSVSTTPGKTVVVLGDGRGEHETYPTDGRRHVTQEGATSSRSFLAPAPAYSDLAYWPLATITIPTDARHVAREYRPSSAKSFAVPGPTEGAKFLEVGMLGPAATPELVSELGSHGGWQGSESGLTIVFRTPSETT